MDGTLIQAWAGHKSFVRKDGSADDGDNANFKDKRRGNDKKKWGKKIGSDPNGTRLSQTPVKSW
ncbi:MAG: hypothetical protein WA108_01410 [Thiobacillus sp.]